jgi:hypothetical protein
MAVAGIAQAGVPDPDGMLRDLLVQAIDVCAAWSGRDPHPEVLDPPTSASPDWRAFVLGRPA